MEQKFVWHDQDEKRLLQRFSRWLIETCKITKEFSIQPFLTGYNIDHFDIKFLRVRAGNFGIGFPELPTKDLMRILYPPPQRFRNFDIAAESLGIKRTNGLRGSNVPKLWKEGDIESIRVHNLDDIRSEFALWKAMKRKRYEV